MTTGTLKTLDGLSVVVTSDDDGKDYVLSARSKDSLKVEIDGNPGYLSQLRVGDRVEVYGDRRSVHTIKVLRDTEVLR